MQELLELTFEMKFLVETEHGTLRDADLSDFVLIADSVFSDAGGMLVRNN